MYSSKLNVLPTAYSAKVHFYTLENEIESYKHLLCLFVLIFPIKSIIIIIMEKRGKATFSQTFISVYSP